MTGPTVPSFPVGPQEQLEEVKGGGGGRMMNGGDGEMNSVVIEI